MKGTPINLGRTNRFSKFTIVLLCFLQGRFEILSLSGSFMPNNNGGTKSISGGMSVSLAGPDGRVMGGGLAGLLIAAGPVQVRYSFKL